MNHKIIPAFTGISKDVSARIIPDDKCQDGSNVVFKDGKIKRRFGYKELGSNLPLSGGVTGIFYAEFISFGSNELLCFTTRDAYRFNFNTGKWNYITQIFTEGTIACSGNTVTLSGSTFNDEEWNKIGVYQIMFGSTDPNSGGTWHTVQEVTADLSLTITDTATVTAGTSYCLRLCFSGGNDNYFSIAQPFDFELNDKMVIASNGIDPIQRWDGTGYMYDLRNTVYQEGTLTAGSKTVTTDTTLLYQDMEVSIPNDTAPLGIPVDTILSVVGTGTATMSASAAISGTMTLKFIGDRVSKAEYVGYFGSIGYEHTVLANVTSVAEGNNQQRIETSLAGSVYFEGTFYDLITNTDKIHGIVPLQTRFMVYKDKSITEMIPNPSGGNDDPFQFNQNKINTIGTPAIRSVQDVGQYHLFFGHDNIYAFDGINVIPIGNDVINDIRQNLNRPYSGNIFAGMLPDDDLYCLFLPYNYTSEVMNQYPSRAYVYDYKDKTWTIWDFNSFITSIAWYKDEYSPAWSSKIDNEYTKSSQTTSGSSTIIVTTTGLSAGMHVRGTGIPRKTATGTSVKITSIGSGNVVINANATETGTNNLRYIDGLDMDEQGMRFEDLILYSNNISHLIGSTDGYIYLLGKDYDDDNGSDITATFVTKDLPLNDTKRNFRLLESVISFLTSNGKYIKIRASVDFGATWTEWVDVPMDGTASHKEYLVNFMERGRQVRFEVANKDSAYFEVESLMVGFNDMGVSRDY